MNAVAEPEAVRRMLDNDGTPGDGEPVPEPGDTQAVDAVEAAHLFDLWLADTKAGCAGQRAIDAAEQEAARLRAEAAEMVREAEEALEFGMIVAEIIQFADQRNANTSTSTSEEEFGLAELLAAAYEAVAGKRVA